MTRNGYGVLCCDWEPRPAKSCVSADAQTFRAYHKSHINKTMGILFVAFAFDDNMEKGGAAIELAFLRAQSHKVARKVVREAVRQEDGSVEYNGPIKRQKGDTYLVDCCVTGSKEGVADDPKFPLKLVFEPVIFPMTKALVGPGGQYESRTVIIQGDNAGPHNDVAFMRYVTGFCDSNGWHWQPQAARMPHMNILDLSVFPCMSRRHTALSRMTGGLKVLTEDEIWKNAETVWNELPSSKIASAFIQASRIAKEIIKQNGDNSFLGAQGRISTGIRRDFNETAKGLSRKDKKKLGAPTT
jgi:hypothetical protein